MVDESVSQAIRNQKHLNATGWVTAAVVISPPDTREGSKNVDESDEDLP